MLKITKQQWDQIPNDYKSIWKKQNQNLNSNIPNEFFGKRTVFEGCIKSGAGIVLITEGVHFVIEGN